MLMLEGEVLENGSITIEQLMVVPGEMHTSLFKAFRLLFLVISVFFFLIFLLIQLLERKESVFKIPSSQQLHSNTTAC